MYLKNIYILILCFSQNVEIIIYNFILKACLNDLAHIN